MNKPARVRCFVGVGSNLGDPVSQAKEAIQALAELPDSQLVLCSGLYCSRPMGPADQPDYVNAVAQLETGLAPLALLDALQAIEQHHGRTRKSERWGPRTLDLDLLLYGKQVIDCPRLIVPHYGMKQREFVLYPLHEIAPQLILPCGTPILELLSDVPLNGLQRL